MGEKEKCIAFTNNARRMFEAVDCGGTLVYFAATTGARSYLKPSPVLL